jgi:hypothetical protein
LFSLLDPPFVWVVKLSHPSLKFQDNVPLVASYYICDGHPWPVMKTAYSVPKFNFYDEYEYDLR